MENWKRILILTILTFVALGCTGSLDWQAHYPGKLNAVDEYQTRPATVHYKGSYRPPFPMAPPK